MELDLNRVEKNKQNWKNNDPHDVDHDYGGVHEINDRLAKCGIV